MARKDLAGLAALGALGYMLNRDKPTQVEDRSGSSFSMRGGAEDERPAPTGMGEATQLLSDRNENFSNEGRTGITRTPVGAVPRPRPRPMAAAPVAAPQQTAPAGPVNPIDELNRATGTKPMDPNSDRGPNAVTGTELDRNVNNAMNAVGGGGLRMVRNLARAKAEADMARAATTKGGKLAEYITPELGYSQKVLQNNPTKQLTGPSKAELVARDRAARAAEREAGRKEFNQRGVDRFVESTFEGGMKRGGKVKKMASGGMARSSASSRGDGIASKGKTRGRIY
jgi:hypothetical protein